jgi:nucleotide-binding universal stress UspA family protein
MGMNAMTTARPVVVGIDPVVVGIDDSGRAEQILEWALAEAVLCQAPLRVVTVWNWDGKAPAGPSTRRPVGSLSRPEGWARQTQETMVARVLARFGSPAPRVISEVAEGDPAAQLIQRSRGAELLIVGGDAASREPGARTVAEVCRRYAGCPVVVVPPESRVPRPPKPRLAPPARRLSEG